MKNQTQEKFIEQVDIPNQEDLGNIHDRYTDIDEDEEDLKCEKCGSGEDLKCEKCGSGDTYYRKKDKKRVCRKCGFNGEYNIIKKEKVTPKPCNKCGSKVTYVRLNNTQICRKCGNVEDRRLKCVKTAKTL
jgi:predicted RNA-binding Zn-ribbon protein involved in translation (DUF1610 family)